MNILSLSAEVVCYLVYESKTLTATDVLNLALSCKTLNHILLGGEFERDLHKSMKGMLHCICNALWRPARLAFNRGRYAKMNACLEQLCEIAKNGIVVNEWEVVRLVTEVRQSKKGSDPKWNLVNVPLCYFAQNNNVDKVSDLFDECEPKFHDLVLSFACSAGAMDVISFLLTKCSLSTFYPLSFFNAIEKDDDVIVELLLDRNQISTQEEFRFLLNNSARLDAPKSLDLFVNVSRFSRSYLVENAFCNACKYNSKKVVEYMLSSNTLRQMISVRNGLYYASCRNRVEIVDMILPVYDQCRVGYGGCPIHKAALLGHVGILERLMNHKVSKSQVSFAVTAFSCGLAKQNETLRVLMNDKDAKESNGLMHISHKLHKLGYTEQAKIIRDAIGQKEISNFFSSSTPV